MALRRLQLCKESPLPGISWYNFRMGDVWYILTLAIKSSLTVLLLLAAFHVSQPPLSQAEERIAKSSGVFKESQRMYAVLAAIILIGLVWSVPMSGD